MTEADEIVVYNVDSGDEESSITVAAIHCVASHDSMPVLVVGSRNGFVYIIAVVDPKVAIILHTLHLCRDKIDGIQFVSCTHHAVACAGTDFFLIEVMPLIHAGIITNRHHLMECFVFTG